MNNFLNATQCDLLIAKLDASDRIASVAYEKNRRGVDAETARTSTHVRVAKAETVGLHQRVAELTRRSVANMESVGRAVAFPLCRYKFRAARRLHHTFVRCVFVCVCGDCEQAKIIHYQREQEFTRHFDYSATAGKKEGRFKSLDGRSIPRHVNRELTLFVFLNDVARGGETAFFDASTNWQTGPEYMRIKPERGLAVLFYATVQPDDGVFPRAASTFGARDGFRVDPFSLHAGLPAVDDKYLLVQWIWPGYLNHDFSDLNNIYHTETRHTDGVVV